MSDEPRHLRRDRALYGGRSSTTPGSTAQRIASLEKWRDELRTEFHELRASIEELKDLIRGDRE
jgi:hypothetical protein